MFTENEPDLLFNITWNEHVFLSHGNLNLEIWLLLVHIPYIRLNEVTINIVLGILRYRNTSILFNLWC